VWGGVGGSRPIRWRRIFVAADLTVIISSTTTRRCGISRTTLAFLTHARGAFPDGQAPDRNGTRGATPVAATAARPAAGCAGPHRHSLERRRLQTRRIDGITEKELLSAAAGVLQDLGFNIDESETRLGVIVASKDRSAFTPSQVAGAIALALFGVSSSIDKTQKIRVSLVTRPAIAADGSARTDSQMLRITIQRMEQPAVADRVDRSLDLGVLREAPRASFGVQEI
jgi:hypothetical protein